MEDCINLLRVHPSIGVHKKLTLLNLEGCKNLKTLPKKFEMESLEILILSGCSKLKNIPEFGENMPRLLKLFLDGTAITKLPTSIGHLIGLASLNIRDCKSLMCLPSSFFNLKLLKDLDMSGCLKLERLPKNLGNIKSLEKLNVRGTAIRELHSSIGFLKNLKMLPLYECRGLTSSNNSGLGIPDFYSMPRIPNPMRLSLLLGLSSLTELKLRNCNLMAIPNVIGSLFSLKEIDLSGNNFVCLPESINGLCKLRMMELENCTSLQLLPKLPLSITTISASGCTSLNPNSLCDVEPFLSNCSQLADNQGVISMFSIVIRKHFQVALSLSLNSLLCMFQGLYVDSRYDILSLSLTLSQ